MSEPFALGAISSATGVFSGFSQHFRPSRSPYLLAGMLSILSLVSIAGLPESREVFLLIFVPLGFVFTFLSVLCFYFKPFKPETAEEEREFKKEMDEQFKFSRTVCLSIGILLLAYILYKVRGQSIIEIPILTKPPTPIPMGVFFWLAYAGCLIHLVIFVIYIMFRNIQEESSIRISLFQITFFTVASLVGLIFTCSNLHDQSALLFNCSNRIEYLNTDKNKQTIKFPNCDAAAAKKRLDETAIAGTIKGESEFSMVTDTYPDPNKILFWYLLIHLIVFEAFWLKRLVSVVQFRFDVVITD